MNIFITLFLTIIFIISSQGQTDNLGFNLKDSLKLISDMPYICHDLNDAGLSPGCGSPFVWKAVKQRSLIIDSLIELIHDPTESLAYVPNVGGNYSVGDIAYEILGEIIHGIPTFELAGIKFDAEGCGGCLYWQYLREDPKNREKFQKSVSKWYRENKIKLVWVESDDFEICDCIEAHPNGGHYEVKK